MKIALIVSQTTRIKANRSNQFHYTRERINFWASLIILLAVLVLLMVPVYILCNTIRRGGSTGGNITQDQTASCVGVLLVSTLLFSAVISLFTRAKRHEVLGAAAA